MEGSDSQHQASTLCVHMCPCWLFVPTGTRPPALKWIGKWFPYCGSCFHAVTSWSSASSDYPAGRLLPDAVLPGLVLGTTSAHSRLRDTDICCWTGTPRRVTAAIRLKEEEEVNHIHFFKIQSSEHSTDLIISMSIKSLQRK